MSNSLINAAAGMLLLVTGFACSVIVARLLGPAASGTVAFALWVAATGSLVAELGTGILLLRLLPQLKAKGVDADERRGFAAFLAVPVVLATSLLTALYALFCWKGGGLEWSNSTASVAAFAIALLFIQSIGSFTKNYLIGETRLGTFFIFTVIASILQLGIVLGGARLAGTEGVLIGYIAGQSVFFIYTLRILSTRRRKAGHSGRALAATSLLLFFEFLITAVFLTRPELVFLQHFRDTQDVGFYAVALSLANLALQLPVQLAGSLIPFYAERHETEHDISSADLFAAVVRSLSYITLPLCFGLAAVASPLVVAVFGSAFEPAAMAVAILAVGSPAYVFMLLVTQYLYSRNQVTDRLVISSIGALLMVVGCLVAVPSWAWQAQRWFVVSFFWPWAHSSPVVSPSKERRRILFWSWSGQPWLLSLAVSLHIWQHAHCRGFSAWLSASRSARLSTRLQCVCWRRYHRRTRQPSIACNRVFHLASDEWRDCCSV
ncbi:lipopolysaccharide biosynthesis protein [Mesorhizobium sp. UC22_110]|uniref:lipopolysaccharide biosynthesis protein n=1 Tax=Mesorhizobium sp. UC22_110 TaxID=3374552 RepID=UPI0037568156